MINVAVIIEADDSDQALVHTENCTSFKCDKAELLLRGRFWCCPACGLSYGADARHAEAI